MAAIILPRKSGRTLETQHFRVVLDIAGQQTLVAKLTQGGPENLVKGQIVHFDLLATHCRCLTDAAAAP